MACHIFVIMCPDRGLWQIVTWKNHITYPLYDLECLIQVNSSSSWLSSLFITTRKAPFIQGCDLCATFERPEIWPGRSVVAQTQKVMFLCNCCSTTLERSLNPRNCCGITTGRAKEAEWRQNHYYGGRGRRMEAQWSPQWSLMGRYWLAKEGTVVVQGRQEHRQNWHTMFTTVRFILRGDQWPTPVHPFCDHGDACAFLLPPLSDLSATDLLGDLCATVLNMLKISLRPWRPWRRLNVFCATLERPRQPFCFPMCRQRRPGQFCGRTREAQRSQPLCKGGINNNQSAIHQIQLLPCSYISLRCQT